MAPDDPTAEVLLYGVRELEPAHDALLRSSSATVIVLGWGLCSGPAARAEAPLGASP